MSSRQTGTCSRCGRELRGAIETNYMSLGRLVCITSIETPDCNWTTCSKCKKSVCKSCFIEVKATCTYCLVVRPFQSRPDAAGNNGTGSDVPEGPKPLKRAA